MKTKPSYIKPISINAFHHHDGINGLIVGVEFVTPTGLNKRLCYKVDYLDMYDYIPLSEVADGIYKIVDSIS